MVIYVSLTMPMWQFQSFGVDCYAQVRTWE